MQEVQYFMARYVKPGGGTLYCHFDGNLYGNPYLFIDETTATLSAAQAEIKCEVVTVLLKSPDPVPLKKWVKYDSYEVTTKRSWNLFTSESIKKMLNDKTLRVCGDSWEILEYTQ